MKKLIMPTLIALFVLIALFMGSKHKEQPVKTVAIAKPAVQQPVAKKQQACIACHVSRASQAQPAAVPASVPAPPQPREKAAVATSLKHVVIKGQCLWTIAERYYRDGSQWTRIHEANPGIKNPHLIHPDQALVIPIVNGIVQPDTSVPAERKAKQAGKTHTGKTAAKASAGVFLWTIAGGNPFGKRDHRKALNLLPTDDQELKNLLVKTFTSTTPQATTVKPGTDFDWILFGNYHWVHTARWSGQEELQAQVWPEFEHKGRLWTITLTSKCNNLEISSRPLPPAVPVIPQEPPKSQPPQPPKEGEPPPPPPPPQKETPPQPPLPPQKETPPPPPPAEKPCCKWTPDYKGALFIAPRWGVNYPNKDKEMIYGGEMDIFPGYCGDKNRTFYPGASIKGVGWDGQFGEKNGGLLKFKGNQIVYGGVLEVRQPNDLSILHLRYGEQEGWAKNNTGYEGREENELINVEARHLHKTGHDWPSEVQVAGSANIDIGGKKQSWVNGKAMTAAQDPRRDQSQFALMGQASLYASDKVEPLVGLVVDHTPGAKMTGVEPYVGAKVLEEQLEPSARYRFNIGKDDPSDTFGANVVWNFDRTFKKAYHHVVNSWANRGVTEAQAAEPAALPLPLKTSVPVPAVRERP
ncbi:LysM peptidoglycan-binding domain-containing protein [Candidatus Falkowbacteria bacterium]|nr:LysM peptidoglycan-binding domain-containing protein [Candidatus Falkowbacteria bacterium]